MEKKTQKRPYYAAHERRELILDAAHTSFITAGYRATSLRDIARAAGISHPGLLRHFSSKAEILTALIVRLDERSDARWDAVRTTRERMPDASDYARANQEIPGWVELFTALLGEATSPEHPGNALMLARREEVARRARVYAAAHEVPKERVEPELRLVVASWEGLQILSLYFPDVDVVDQLARHQMLHGPGGPTPAGPPPSPVPPAPEGGPRRPRRDVALAAADQYARHGYYETSMQAVADDAGITRAALIHLAPTKRALLDLVLAELFGDAMTEGEAFDLARRPRSVTAAEAVLICEATVPAHPAHEFFRNRLATARAAAAARMASDDVHDPVGEADWIVAIRLGVLIAWLYEPDQVDPAALMAGALSRLRSQRVP